MNTVQGRGWARGPLRNGGHTPGAAVASGFSEQPRIPESSYTPTGQQMKWPHWRRCRAPEAPSSDSSVLANLPMGTRTYMSAPSTAPSWPGGTGSLSGKNNVTHPEAKRKIGHGEERGGQTDTEPTLPSALHAEHVVPPAMASTVLLNPNWGARGRLQLQPRPRGSRPCSKCLDQFSARWPQLSLSKEIILSQKPGGGQGGLGEEAWSGQGTGQDGAGKGGSPDIPARDFLSGAHPV